MRQNGLEFYFCKATSGATGLSYREAQGVWSPLVMTVVGVIIWEGLLHGSLLILPVLPPGWLASCFKGHSPVEYWLLRFRLEGWGGGDKTDDGTHRGLVCDPRRFPPQLGVVLERVARNSQLGSSPQSSELCGPTLSSRSRDAVFRVGGFPGLLVFPVFGRQTTPWRVCGWEDTTTGQRASGPYPGQRVRVGCISRASLGSGCGRSARGRGAFCPLWNVFAKNGRRWRGGRKPRGT